MPTLLEKGSIVPAKWMKKADVTKIKNTISVEYIMEFIENRIYTQYETPPKIKVKGIGSKVLVLRSGTGSGKSTTLPPYLYNTFFERLHKSIIVTQPTVATATEIPYQIMQYNKNFKLGENIGYQTGIIARKPSRGILFTTVGIPLQFLKTMTDEQFMKKFAFVIIDEVHKRSMDEDMLLFYLKQLLSRNWDKPECPLIILTSGTFEPGVFMEYFECPKEHFIDVTGSTFPTQDIFSPFGISDYIGYSIDLIEKIHIENISDITENNIFRDILIFVQGATQIKQLVDKIHYLNAEVFKKGLQYAKEHVKAQVPKYITGGSSKELQSYYLAPIALMSDNIKKGGKEYRDLYSDIDSVSVALYEFDSKKQRTEKVIGIERATRRVMIGTNAIETGLTIDTLKYCIDTGWVKENQFDPNFGCHMLINKSVTQASSRQRRGRVGRKAPGIFHACYTKASYDQMTPLPFPDIVKEDLTLFLLSVIIRETETKLEEINASDKDENCFQMNQFDQKWYKLQYEKPFNASLLDFIQFPPADSIGSGIEKLYGLGFIDHEYKPTLFGWYGSLFRKFKLENIRMILAGYQHGANVLDLITIACFIEAGRELGIRRNKYKPRNPLGVSEKEATYYYKLVFCDEFIEYLFIWNDFMEIIGKMGQTLEKTTKLSKSSVMSVNYLPQWCKENHFNYDGFMKIIDLRDELLATMLSLGLNPYYNGLELVRGSYNLISILQRNLTEGMNEIIKIKKCIYEGYRFNLYMWNDVLKAYTSNYSHNTISLDTQLTKSLPTNDNFEQNKPQKIIVGNVVLKESFHDKGMYEFSGENVSVLDGYVNVDVTFLDH